MKIRWLFIAFLVLSLALSLLGGYTMAWRFFVFGIALAILSLLWLLRTVRSIEAKVDELPRYCRVGEGFTEEITFVNRGFLPADLNDVRQHTNLPGYKGKGAFHLPAYGSYRWQTPVACTKRGEFNLGSVTARIADPLGLVALKRDLSYPHYVVVFPDTVEVPYFQALPYNDPGSSPRRWFATQTSPNASRVREYTSGDSLRNIHWRTTAHTNKLMVKEYDPDRLSYVYKDIWIVLDMLASSYAGSGTESTTEYGVTIASSIVKKYLEAGKKVGFLANGEKSYLFLPENSEEQMENIMRSLAIIQAGGAVPVDNMLQAQEERFSAGSAVIVITPSDLKPTGSSLRRIVKRGAIVSAILLDGVSFGGTISAVDTARGLATTGAHTYLVRRGSNISRALDSRFVVSPMQDTGVKSR